MELQLPVVIGIVVGLLVVMGFVYAVQRIKRRRALGDRLEKLTGFSATDTLLDADGTVGLALDEPNGKLALIRCDWDHCKVYSASEVVAVELLERGRLIAQSRPKDYSWGKRPGNQGAKAAGAAWQNLVAKARFQEPRAGLVLRVIVNDNEAPVHELSLWDEEAEEIADKGRGNANSTALKETREAAKAWQQRLEALIAKPSAEPGDAA